MLNRQKLKQIDAELIGCQYYKRRSHKQKFQAYGTGKLMENFKLVVKSKIYTDKKLEEVIGKIESKYPTHKLALKNEAGAIISSSSSVVNVFVQLVEKSKNSHFIFIGSSGNKVVFNDVPVDIDGDIMMIGAETSH